MKGLNDTGIYISPECVVLGVEVSQVLASSPIVLKHDIRDLIWDLDGDYGLE